MLRFLRGGNKRTKTIWWVLIIVTVVTFLGGFVFLLGSGLNASYQARVSGAIGTVDGEPITRVDYQNAIVDQRETYRRQNGSDAGDRELRMLEFQAWRSLIVQRLMASQARKLGLKVYDHEVAVGVRSSPPPSVTSQDAFKTDGKFDFAKYQAALTNPGNEPQVAQLEAMTRAQLPMRKLQERLLTSIKLAAPELSAAYHDQYDRIAATVAIVAPATEGKDPVPSEADLDRIYKTYKNRFVTGARTQLELLRAPKDYGADETKAARDQAQSLVNRAHQGESFAVLARDYSEGPGADKGGVIDRVFSPADFGPDLGAKLAVLDTGGVSEPFGDGGSFRIFKVLERAMDPNTGQPGIKVAQIVVNVRANDARIRDQYASLGKLRAQATKIGLGHAAASKGLSTTTTSFFDANNSPPELLAFPEVADWGLIASANSVSPVFEGNDEFVIAQVSTQKPAGLPTRQELADPLRRFALIDARTEQSKPKATALAQALQSGQPLEQAAAGAGATVIKIESMTRAQPDPRLAGSPEVVGALFGSPPGKLIGPIRLVNGWFFARLDQSMPADMGVYEQVKGQISSQLLQRRQQSYMNAFLMQARAQAKVKDLRGDPVN